MTNGWSNSVSITSRSSPETNGAAASSVSAMKSLDTGLFVETCGANAAQFATKSGSRLARIRQLMMKLMTIFYDVNQSVPYCFGFLVLFWIVRIVSAARVGNEWRRAKRCTQPSCCSLLDGADDHIASPSACRFAVAWNFKSRVYRATKEEFASWLHRLSEPQIHQVETAVDTQTWRQQLFHLMGCDSVPSSNLKSELVEPAHAVAGWQHQTTQNLMSRLENWNFAKNYL